MPTCKWCGKRVEAGWSYCPHCGESLASFRSIFDDFFRGISSEFEKFDELFKKLKPIRGGGISVTITSGTGMEPRVEIRTSGDFRELEPELRRRLGVEEKKVKVEVEEAEKPARPIKVAEEPESKVERLGDKMILEIKLPGVKRMEDVEIRRLEQSIEVKAYAKDKAYFKLFPIPQDAEITDKRLEKEKLIIEIAY